MSVADDVPFFFFLFLLFVVVNMKHETVLVLPVSFELCDHNHTGKIKQDDMEQVLIAINDTASYFGDPVLKHAQVKVRMTPKVTQKKKRDGE